MVGNTALGQSIVPLVAAASALCFSQLDTILDESENSHNPDWTATNVCLEYLYRSVPALWLCATC